MTDTTSTQQAPTDPIVSLAHWFWIDLPRRVLRQFPGARGLAGDGHYVVTVPALAVVAPAAAVVAGLWLGAGADLWDVTFTESLPTMALAIGAGILSAVVGLLLVTSMALADIVTTVTTASGATIPTLASLLVSHLLLASAVVIIPRTGRALGESIARTRRIPNQLAWPISSLLVVVVAWFGTRAWVAMAPTLVRPRFVWQGVPPTVDAIAPLQQQGDMLVAVAIATAVLRQLWLGATMVPGPLADRMAAAESRPLTGSARHRPQRVPGALRRGLSDLVGTVIATAVLSGILESWTMAAVAFGVFLTLRMLRSGTLVVPGVASWQRLATRVPAVVRLVLLWVIARVGTDALAANFITSYTGLALMVIVGATLVWLLFPGQPRDDGQHASSTPAGPLTLVVVATGLSLAMVALGQTPALADNCSVFTDCFNQSNAAAEAGFALMLLTGLSILLDFVPIVGDAKGVIEAITGRDLLTGEELAPWERALGLIPFVPLDALPALRRVDDLVDLRRRLSDPPPVGRPRPPRTDGHVPPRPDRPPRGDSPTDLAKKAQEDKTPLPHRPENQRRVDDLVEEYNDPATTTQRKKDISEELGEIGGIAALKHITGRDVPILRPTSPADVDGLRELIEAGEPWPGAVTYNGSRVTNMVYFDGETLHIIEAKGGGGRYGDRDASTRPGRIDQRDPDYPYDVAEDMRDATKQDGRQDIGEIIQDMYGEDRVNYMGVRTGPRADILNGDPSTFIEHILNG